jgi:hypothetical protein
MLSTGEMSDGSTSCLIESSLPDGKTALADDKPDLPAGERSFRITERFEAAFNGQ